MLLAKNSKAAQTHEKPKTETRNYANNHKRVKNFCLHTERKKISGVVITLSTVLASNKRRLVVMLRRSDVVLLAHPRSVFSPPLLCLFLCELFPTVQEPNIC